MKGIDPIWLTVISTLVAIDNWIGGGNISLVHVFPTNWIPWIIGWAAFLGGILGFVVAALTTVISAKPGFLINPPSSATKAALIAAIALSGLLCFGGTARAADNLPTSSAVTAINQALTGGYPTKCGAYYGIGTGGNAGAVGGAAVGSQIVQGDLDLIVGYTCPFAGNAFWFAETQGGFSNLNGSSNGLSLSGPGLFIERVGVGSPIQQYLSAILPNLNLPAVPSLPSTPGATPGTPASYGFAGLVEQDFGAQVGSATGHDWLLSPIIGVGMLTRYSNSMVVDTWAGWQMNATNSICLPTGGCVKPGNMARIGVSLKY